MEREPQPLLMSVGVRTCKGEISMYMPYKSREGEVAMAQCIMSNEHDKFVHKDSEPCRKTFFKRV